MRIAVTGASGFIGRHVLQALSVRGADIVAVTRDAARLRGAEANVQIVEMDIGNPAGEDFQRMGSPDALIHLAWDGLPNYKSLHHFETELPKQYRFLKNLIDNGLPAVVVTGTCFEYGMQSGALPADMQTCPDNPYGYAKDALRKQLQFLQLNQPLKLTWARLFYMYGEGQAGNSLYPALKAAVMRGDPTFNMSGGEQLRDYLPVETVARELADLAIARCDAGVMNLCSGTPISVRRLVEQWIGENQWRISLNLGHYPYPDYEPMAFWGEKNRLDKLP